jgi:thiamine transport system substrate-binding protein
MRSKHPSSSPLSWSFALVLLLVLVLASLLASCAKKEDPELTVYTYDSFVADWGAGPAVAALFEKQSGIKVRFVSKGDGGQLLAAAVQERKKPEADIVLGLDNQLAPKALAADLFQPYEAKGLSGLPAWLRLDPSKRLTPFDYGHFAIIWDSKRLALPPASLEDLTKPEYARKLIIMDPRTSTPGLGFLAWTEAVYGASWADYWKRLQPSILAMTPNWDTGYGLFTSGEAPLVLSYATSPAYHLENDKTDRYRALEFKEGHPVQIEVAGIVKGAKHLGNARLFMDFLLSADCQALLPLTQYMYPVNPEVKLPESYSLALKPTLTLTIDAAHLADDAERAAAVLAAK